MGQHHRGRRPHPTGDRRAVRAPCHAAGDEGRRHEVRQDRGGHGLARPGDDRRRTPSTSSGSNRRSRRRPVPEDLHRPTRDEIDELEKATAERRPTGAAQRASPRMSPPWCTGGRVRSGRRGEPGAVRPGASLESLDERRWTAALTEAPHVHPAGGGRCRRRGVAGRTGLSSEPVGGASAGWPRAAATSTTPGHRPRRVPSRPTSCRVAGWCAAGSAIAGVELERLRKARCSRRRSRA